MKKCNRLLKNSEFKKIIESGKKINSYNFFACYKVNQDFSYKIGITISKKVSKLAVTRNLIKRRIVAAINELEINKTQINKDIVIIAKPTASNLQYQDIKKEIFFLFNKILGKDKDGKEE